MFDLEVTHHADGLGGVYVITTRKARLDGEPHERHEHFAYGGGGREVACREAINACRCMDNVMRFAGMNCGINRVQNELTMLSEARTADNSFNDVKNVTEVVTIAEMEEQGLLSNDGGIVG